MEKIIWYVGNNEEDSSLNILFRGLKKYSNFEYIKGLINPQEVLDSDASILIGSYRYYEGSLLNKMKQKFSNNCYCFIHGFNTGKDTRSKFKNIYSRLHSNDVKLLVSCEYALGYLEDFDLEGTILPFALDFDEFSYVSDKNPNDNRSPLIFGMCYQRRKAHRKGGDILDRLARRGFDTKVADNIPHNELYKFFNSIDCLIVASDDDGRETFCLPIIEAGACGVPTISTPVGCSSEFILNDYNGYIVTNRDEILNIASDYSRSDYVEMGHNAREVTLEERDWEIVVKTWDSFLGGYSDGFE